MSVGLLVVRLKYGLYVVHLSIWFVFVLMLNLKSLVQWLQCRHTLAGNVCICVIMQIYNLIKNLTIYINLKFSGCDNIRL